MDRRMRLLTLAFLFIAIAIFSHSFRLSLVASEPLAKDVDLKVGSNGEWATVVLTISNPNRESHGYTYTVMVLGMQDASARSVVCEDSGGVVLEPGRHYSHTLTFKPSPTSGTQVQVKVLREGSREPLADSVFQLASGGLE